MTLFLQELIVGLTNGAIYALIALGYTMVYGIIELINFAHGDIFMIGSFVSITIFGLLGITSTSHPAGFTLVAILVVTCLGWMLICAALEVVIERVVSPPTECSGSRPVDLCYWCLVDFSGFGSLWRRLLRLLSTDFPPEYLLSD